MSALGEGEGCRLPWFALYLLSYPIKSRISHCDVSIRRWNHSGDLHYGSGRTLKRGCATEVSTSLCCNFVWFINKNILSRRRPRVLQLSILWMGLYFGYTVKYLVERQSF